MSENLQTSLLTVVYKLDEAPNSRGVPTPPTWWLITFLDFMLKSKEWKVETHIDGFGRRYVTLEIPLPPLSSIDETEKSGSLYFARKTLSGLSDHLPKDPSIRKITEVCPGDGMYCYQYKDREEAHWRCGTGQCGMTFD